MSTTPPGRRLKRAFFLGLVVLAAGFALYTWSALSFEYSSGERAGVLQKFSRRGWVCKTYEGELALYVVAGVQPEVWDFSVRDATVARELESAVGQRVQLHYLEHRGIPSSCFGDTTYFVDRIARIAEAPSAGPPPAR